MTIETKFGPGDTVYRYNGALVEPGEFIVATLIITRAEHGEPLCIEYQVTNYLGTVPGNFKESDLVTFKEWRLLTLEALDERHLQVAAMSAPG